MKALVLVHTLISPVLKTCNVVGYHGALKLVFTPRTATTLQVFKTGEIKVYHKEEGFH
jgi:hypothetical protein